MSSIDQDPKCGLVCYHRTRRFLLLSPEKDDGRWAAAATTTKFLMRRRRYPSARRFGHVGLTRMFLLLSPERDKKGQQQQNSCSAADDIIRPKVWASKANPDVLAPISRKGQEGAATIKLFRRLKKGTGNNKILSAPQAQKILAPKIGLVGASITRTRSSRTARRLKH